MTITTKNSACVINTDVSQENSNVCQGSSSSAQETKMQDPDLQPTTSQVQFMPAMYMPYTEGPKMDWTINDGLYHRFVK